MERTPIHPGEVLADELLELGSSAAASARLIGVPANRVSRILADKRAITAKTALRLAHYFDTSPEDWLNLQKTYALDLARAELGRSLETLPRRALMDA